MGANLVRVSPWTAQRMGAIVGAALAITWVIYIRTRATPCPGAVTLEFHPPLADPGNYRIQLTWDGGKPCELAVAVPLDGSAKDRAKTGCGMALQLRTQVQDGKASISGLTFAAAPERFKLSVHRNGEAVYDTDVAPKYAPYETSRAEDRHFCGDRALVLPPCLRGSSECAPFPANCTGPEGCGPKQACCLTPEWGKDFGPKAASECSSANGCFAHLGHLGCHLDADCPADMRCADASLSADFSPSVLVCQGR
jgi:hypothetical protein